MSIRGYVRLVGLVLFGVAVYLWFFAGVTVTSAGFHVECGTMSDSKPLVYPEDLIAGYGGDGHVTQECSDALVTRGRWVWLTAGAGALVLVGSFVVRKAPQPAPHPSSL